MTRDATPFFLHEAVLTLYRTDASGEQLASAGPVWLGVLAGGIRLEESLDKVKAWSTGDARTRTQHLDENHAIEIQRTWMVRATTGLDFRLVRNQRYVLEIVWAETRGKTFPPATWKWYKRTYYGVTISRLRTESRGPLHSEQTQSLEAERYVAQGGAGDPEVTVPSAPSGEEQMVLFVKETPLIDDEYLAGAYRWSHALTGVSATVHAHGTLSTPVTLTLEVDGVLTAYTLAIAAGADVTDEVDLSALEIPALAVVRWRVTSAPIPEESAYNVSVEMGVA